MPLTCTVPYTKTWGLTSGECSGIQTQGLVHKASRRNATFNRASLCVTGAICQPGNCRCSAAMCCVYPILQLRKRASSSDAAVVVLGCALWRFPLWLIELKHWGGPLIKLHREPFIWADCFCVGFNQPCVKPTEHSLPIQVLTRPQHQIHTSQVHFIHLWTN